MSNLINRALQHPHLASWTDDYPKGYFTVTEHPKPTTENGSIYVSIKMETNSVLLHRLIGEKKAAYAAVVDCSSTFSTHVETATNPNLRILLPAASYKADFSITPHILTVAPLHLTTCDEHADEYRITRPDGFNLPPGSILATSHLIKYSQGETDATSVIDLVAVEGIPEGKFHITLDDNRIKINVSPEHLNQIRLSRNAKRDHPRNVSLFPTYYQAALREAIGHLPEYPDRQWSATIAKALERNGIELDYHDPHARALEHAQTLLNNPSGDLLSAFDDLDIDGT